MLRFIQGLIPPQPQTMTNQPHQTQTGQCTVAELRGDQIVFVFDDGAEDVCDFDITTRQGQLLFAAEAEKLGLGKRRDLAAFVSRPLVDGPIVVRPADRPPG